MLIVQEIEAQTALQQPMFLIASLMRLLRSFGSMRCPPSSAALQQPMFLIASAPAERESRKLAMASEFAMNARPESSNSISAADIVTDLELGFVGLAI
ncbi:hypothetical protein [Breoghania sp.]|uniref:hypothetical protein n=1 Tax=Breoghania sp. TaxID=2065378 RepID=UPI0029CA7688|nr:hypothetical protein [Breoghania sp.]